MTDNEIIKVLQENRERLSPVALVELLNDLIGGALSQGSLVTYFKRAFPGIPLRVLLDLGAWTRVGGGDLTDEEVDLVLGSYLNET